MEEANQVPDYLQDIYEILKCAFPDGISEEEYWPVLALLHQVMSHRTLARVLSIIADKMYIEVYNDASGFGLDPLPHPDEIEKVRQKLNPCGFEEWFQHNDLS
jgi:hypothetical protein